MPIMVIPNQTKVMSYFAIRALSTGQAVTGLAYNTVAAAYSVSTESISSATTTIALTSMSPSATWASGGFFEVDSTYKKGEYGLCVPDAVFATAGAKIATVSLTPTTTDYYCAPKEYQFNSPASVIDKTGFSLATTQAFNNSGTWTGNISGNITGSAGSVTTDIGKYVHGAVWIDTVRGASGTTNYVNGIPSNPCDTLTNARSVGDNLKLWRYWIQTGSAIALDASYSGYVFGGRGYTMALAGKDISKCQFDMIEGLTGTGLCATGEAIFSDCHLGPTAVTIGEADFNRCHLNAGVVMSQASVPYLFHSCVGISGAKITFSAANQTCVIAKWSGPLTIAGMVSTNTLYLDGNGEVTFDNTNNTGTVYLSGNMTIVDSGTTMHIHDESRFGEDQSLATITGAVGSVTAAVTAGTVPALVQADVRSALGMASANLDTQLADIPTVAEFNARSMTTADYATAASIITVNAGVTTAITQATEANAHAHAIDLQTAKLSFTTANQIDANVQYVNDKELTGDGSALTPWGPA
jgi:hypothetical protein